MAKDPRVTRIEDLPGPKSKGEMDEMKMPYEEYCKKIFDVGNEHAKPTALKGIRWLSCTMYIFTPHSVANLAELGAECIKIEMSRMGHAMRHTSPFNEAYLYRGAWAEQTGDNRFLIAVTQSGNISGQILAEADTASLKDWR